MMNLIRHFAALPKTSLRIARELWRQLWTRVMLMGALALFSLAFAEIVGRFLPEQLASSVSGQAADRLLTIIASAMLAVTTFSLTVMVTVYRSSSSQFTPRLHRLIVQDPTTQNTLATFIGAYVYALVAIILRELAIFRDDKALVLFVITVLVLGLVVYSMVRWVLHLQQFGSLTNTTRQVEEITRKQFDERLATPCLGGHAWTDDAPPDGALPILSRSSAYVQQIYQESLQERAAQAGLNIYLPASVGSFVLKGAPLAYIEDTGDVEGDADLDNRSDMICSHIQQGDMRTYEQDPRFGLLVLGEIASKALSPGINDPGTAIDVITRLARILWEYPDELEERKEPELDRLWIRPLNPDDLFEDAFGALARDGAKVVEVQQRLQSALSQLMAHQSPKLAEAAKETAIWSYQRASMMLEFEPDQKRLRSSTHAEVVDAAQ